MSDPKSTLETLTFEQALSELEAIVEQLERGDVSLDTAIDAYARGMSLKAHCQARLEEARLRVEKIKVPSGDATSPTAAPFDPAEM
jgi:exodeoxyribonuclease VII small subunit